MTVQRKPAVQNVASNPGSTKHLPVVTGGGETGSSTKGPQVTPATSRDTSSRPTGSSGAGGGGRGGGSSSGTTGSGKGKGTGGPVRYANLLEMDLSQCVSTDKAPPNKQSTPGGLGQSALQKILSGGNPGAALEHTLSDPLAGFKVLGQESAAGNGCLTPLTQAQTKSGQPGTNKTNDDRKYLTKPYTIFRHGEAQELSDDELRSLKDAYENKKRLDSGTFDVYDTLTGYFIKDNISLERLGLLYGFGSLPDKTVDTKKTDQPFNVYDSETGEQVGTKHLDPDL
jgi:hypothetical protein